MRIFIYHKFQPLIDKIYMRILYIDFNELCQSFCKWDLVLQFL